MKLHAAVLFALSSSVLASSALAQSASTGASANIPPAVAVPSGAQPAMTLKGVGELTYECRAKADAAGAFEWAFVAPDAALEDQSGQRVGKYYGGPTWEHSDGSKVTGKQLAVAPASSGNIPFQLVEAMPAGGSGAFADVAYIQRVNTQGGVAPAMPCDGASVSKKETVKYSADYVFYKK